jgi:hypothetical protein
MQKKPKKKCTNKKRTKWKYANQCSWCSSLDLSCSQSRICTCSCSSHLLATSSCTSMSRSHTGLRSYTTYRRLQTQSDMHHTGNCRPLRCTSRSGSTDTLGRCTGRTDSSRRCSCLDTYTCLCTRLSVSTSSTTTTTAKSY